MIFNVRKNVSKVLFMSFEGEGVFPPKKNWHRPSKRHLEPPPPLLEIVPLFFQMWNLDNFFRPVVKNFFGGKTPFSFKTPPQKICARTFFLSVRTFLQGKFVFNFFLV